ncbi:MAG: DNA repair protein RecO [Gammaproteobacteria bacterium]|nr:DNA repair protein RecO [Gammaproteobacteria bacterium]MCD8543073.1 DNA repair protein RecO [Gammaproteobacteria bacterium]
MDNRQLIDDGFILHRYPYRDTSLILDCFLQNHGRIHCVAKGVRTERSSRKGLLQAFSPLHLMMTGKSALKTLTNVESSGLPTQLIGMPLMCAWYINELLVRLCPKEEPHQHLYFSYRAALLALEMAPPDTRQHDCSKALRLFEKHLLSALGYALPLKEEARSHRAILYDHWYQFIPEHGLVLTTREDRIDSFLGEDIQAIQHDQYNNTRVLAAAKRLMRLALTPLLGGRPLKTRELWHEKNNWINMQNKNIEL